MPAVISQATLLTLIQLLSAWCGISLVVSALFPTVVARSGRFVSRAAQAQLKTFVLILPGVLLPLLLWKFANHNLRLVAIGMKAESHADASRCIVG